MRSFIAPKRILMGPGPSDVSERVLKALANPTIGHLDPDFVALMDEIKALLQYAFQTKNQLTIPVSAPGSAGMETCFMNLITPGDSVLICINGVFGNRMAEVAERAGAKVFKVEFEWGQAVDPAIVEHHLEQLPDVKIVAFVHAETSTGVLSDAKALCELAHRYDCLSLVDAVTSLGGSELRVDDWGIDAIYSGTQKCLSCVPGLSPVSFSDRAVEVIRNRPSKNFSWLLDLQLVMAYWGEGAKRTYHHTAPVNSLYALHESLLMLKEEGLEHSWQRHRLNHLALVAGLEALGLEMLVKPDIRLPQLNLVAIPNGVDDGKIRHNLLTQHQLEIGAGLGKFASKAWRIGLMGNTCHPDKVKHCLNALGAVLDEAGFDCNSDLAMTAAAKIYSS
jgi:alanine-glyoxylate transaminase/serine-glyoxylate transaminase/serine-pyruvate transaminase